MAYINSLIDFDASILNGQYGDNFEIVNKFGVNPDVDSAGFPEDVWNGGGTFTGFSNVTEEFQVFSDSVSDTGVLTITYLPTSTSTAYVTANITLNGTTAVNTGVTGYRMHTARYSSGTQTTFNVGQITVRHRTTTANVFCKMPVGSSQTYVCGYTIPYGYTGIINRIHGTISDSGTPQYASAAIWVRTQGGSPRLRRPFTLSTAYDYTDEIFGGIILSEMSDVIARITAVSANNLRITVSLDILLIKS